MLHKFLIKYDSIVNYEHILLIAYLISNPFADKMAKKKKKKVSYYLIVIWFFFVSKCFKCVVSVGGKGTVSQANNNHYMGDECVCVCVYLNGVFIYKNLVLLIIKRSHFC